MTRILKFFKKARKGEIRCICGCLYSYREHDIVSIYDPRDGYEDFVKCPFCGKNNFVKL